MCSLSLRSWGGGGGGGGVRFPVETVRIMHGFSLKWFKKCKVNLEKM